MTLQIPLIPTRPSLKPQQKVFVYLPTTQTHLSSDMFLNEMMSFGLHTWKLQKHTS